MRPKSALFAVLLLSAATLTGCVPAASTSATHSATSSSTATASAAPKSTISADLLQAEHLVTQEGLAIALASNVLQSQLQLVQDALAEGPATDCTGLPGGGAHKLTQWDGEENNRSLTDITFFDGNCTQQYMSSQATVGQGDNDTISAKATVAYTDPGGKAIGTMTTDANATLTDAGINLAGTGTFTRTGFPTVSLGLACQAESETALDCQGGVTQDFAGLKHSLGSITSLHLTLGSDPQNSPLPFQGSGNTVAVAAPGALSIGSDGTHLSINGATAGAGDAATSGQAGSFSLFPPTPTGWTITSASGDVSFTINVTDDTSRALTATITQASTKKTLATLAVDRSGTGTITYAGQKPSPVGGWLLTD